MSEKQLLLPDIGDFENVEVIELLVAAGDTVYVDRQGDELVFNKSVRRVKAIV